MTDARVPPAGPDTPRTAAQAAHEGLDRAILVALRDMGASAPDRLATRIGASRAGVIAGTSASRVSLWHRGRPSRVRVTARFQLARPTYAFD